LWWDLPLLDSFEIFKAIYKIPAAQYKKNLDLLIDIMDLKDFLNQPVRKLSLGQRMKGEITASLLHNPSILYLDEPTIGLDVLSKNNVLELLQVLNKEKEITILLTSHNLTDIEKVCQRIIIIDKGKVILDDSQEEIKNKFGKNKVIVVEFESIIGNIKVPVGNIVKQENNKVWIEFNKDTISAYDLIASLKENTGVKDISINEDNIESIVTEIYKKGIVNC
jgi:ABC-2 type transport system ATP-binding protein